MEDMCKKRCLQSWALLILRMTLGFIFIAHGGQKVIGWCGGPGIQGFVQWIGGMGVPSWLAYLAAYAEFVGGILMFLGIAAEFGALLTIPVMVGAILMVHGFAHGYFVQNGGYEYPLILIFLALAVIIGGPGKCYLWDPFKKCRC